MILLSILFKNNNYIFFSLKQNEKKIGWMLIKLFIFIYAIIIILKIIYYDIKISVIIPTYNREKLIGDSIKSVLNQTYKNIEVIVVDDGSEDNTKQEIDKIMDNRIRYIKLEQNYGAANARNIGIKNAVGQFISFQDSDDILYPYKLERQMNNIINKKSNLDFCKIKVIFNSSYIFYYPNERQEKSILWGNIFNELISRGNFISTQAILVKAKFIKKYYFDPNIPRLQDYDIILRMIPKVKISYTKDVLLDLIIQPDSITHSKIKLIKAIDILLKKKYNFNSKQKILFMDYLKRVMISISNETKLYWFGAIVQLITVLLIFFNLHLMMIADFVKGNAF